MSGDCILKPDVKYSAKIRCEKFNFLIFKIKCPKYVAEDELFIFFRVTDYVESFG